MNPTGREGRRRVGEEGVVMCYPENFKLDKIHPKQKREKILITSTLKIRYTQKLQ
jgi:hypothetical protein